MAKSRIMFQMTLKEVREGLNEMKTVILPVGCTEQHGYHMPLSVDIHNSVEIAARTSAICGCFVLPPLNYCFSGGSLPGTVNLSPQVYSLVLMDIFRSLQSQGFKNLVVLLGHGGLENTRATLEAAEIYQRLGVDVEDMTVSVVPFWEFSPSYMKSFEEGDFHAGKYETSMMLYWKPEMVRMEEAQLDDPDFVHRMQTDPNAFLSSSRALDSKYVVPRLSQSPEMKVGVMGSFDGVDPELGRAIAEEAAANLAEFIGQLEGRPMNG